MLLSLRTYFPGDWKIELIRKSLTFFRDLPEILGDLTGMYKDPVGNYTNPGYGLSLVETLWNAGSYRQPLEQDGNPVT